MRRHIHVVLIIAVVITAAAIGGPRLGLSVVQAQSGVTYVSQSYASYQTHTLNHPTGVAVTVGGGWPGLYIADTGSHKIQWFDFNNNTLYVFAGTGTAGFADGTTSQAQFHAPTGIGPIYSGWWQDPNNNRHPYMYFQVNDSLNYVVRYVDFGYFPGQYSLTSRVTTAAGNHSQGYVDGAASSAQFSSLAGTTGLPAIAPHSTSPMHPIMQFAL